MYSNLLLFSYLSVVCIVMSVENFIKDLKSTDVLETCVVEIVSSKSLQGSEVAIINDNEVDDYLFKKIHESDNAKIFVKNSNISLSIYPDVYIVHCDDDDTNNFENIIGTMNRDWYHKANALHVIVFTSITEDDLPAMFKVLWSYHIMHVLITIKDTDENASIYSYLPYAAGLCGKDYKHVIKVGRCQRHAVFDVVEKLREYDKPDLRNCSLDILAHHYPPLVLSDLKPADRFAIGIERFLVELLLEKEQVYPNFTFVSETTTFGDIANNFTVTGLMKSLHEKEVDLLFGGFSLNYKRALLFDFMCIHLAFEDIFFLVTPNAELVHRWKIVYMMFEYKVWLLLVFTFLFCSAVLSGFKNLAQRRFNGSTELLLLLGNATQNLRFNRRKKLSENLIIIHWLWFIFVTSCYYQTRLTSYSTYRVYGPQINEYMSLQNYNLTPCIPRDVAGFLKNWEIVPIIHEQYSDTDNCDTADLALDEIVKSLSKYTVTIYYKYLWWASKHSVDKSRVHVMREHIYKTHYALFFKRGFPLLQQFERRMSHIVECGFVQAIKGLLRFPNDLRFASDIPGAFEVCLLTLHDLILPFSILAVGYLAALVVFGIEIFHKSDKIFVLFTN